MSMVWPFRVIQTRIPCCGMLQERFFVAAERLWFRLLLGNVICADWTG